MLHDPKKTTADTNPATWFDAFVSKAKKNGPFAADLEITPEQAAYLLTVNPDNRNLSQRQVDYMAAAISAGEWVFNGETIIISVEGFLNDGQHRLAACVKADKPIRTLVSFGVSREARTTVDVGGRARKVEDLLSMKGVAYARDTGTMALYVFQLQKYNFISPALNYRPAPSFMVDTVLALKGTSRDYTKHMEAVPLPNSKLVGGRALLAAFRWWLTLKADEKDVDAFIEKLRTGSNLPGDSAILFVRNKLMAGVAKDSPSKHGIPVNDRMELLIRAWNAERRSPRLSFTKTPPILGGKLPDFIV